LGADLGASDGLSWAFEVLVVSAASFSLPCAATVITANSDNPAIKNFFMEGGEIGCLNFAGENSY
jgi:hypothetical protein